MPTPEAGRLAARFVEARRPVVFTGAGVSTECGIPDFRSPGGVWARFGLSQARLGRGTAGGFAPPSEFTYRNFVGSIEGRRRYWQLGRETYPLIRAAAPGAVHVALTALHRLGHLDCCITQNIDDLHQRAGLPPEAVIELHGNATRARCLACQAPYSRDELHAWLQDGRCQVPECRHCGGIVKPHTILFGEAMPAAAYMPLHAKRAGAALVIVNLEPTPLDREADLVIRARAGRVMTAVLDAVHAHRQRG
jgi:NAD-dependent deacetylase